MKDTVYLVLTAKGVNRMLKTKKGLNPRHARGNRSLGLKLGERAIRVDVQVEDDVFAPPGVAHVNLNVKPESLTPPTTTGRLEVGPAPELETPDTGTAEGAP